MTKLENSTSDVPKETITNTEETSTSDIAKEDELRSYLAKNLSSLDNTIITKSFDLNSLMGAPFKYSITDDPPTISGGEYGRSYLEQYLEWGNIVAFSPGIGHFLPGMSDDDKQKLISASVNTESNSDENQEMNEAISEVSSSKLYTFIPKSTMYWDYVNTIWKHLITLSDLNNEPSRLAAFYSKLATQGATTTTSSPTTKLGDIRWGGVNESSALNRILYSSIGTNKQIGRDNMEYSFIPFYNDGPVSSSDGFDNQAGESTIGAKINQIPGEEISRELSFLSGATYNYNDEYNRESKLQSSGSGTGLFDTLTKYKTFGVKTTIPDVWKDSGSSARDQTFTFKFACCDGSPESYAIHTLRGLAHLLALALPIHHKGNFAFSAPMLVRVWAKGISNIDIGLITSLQIQKDPKSITAYGIMTDMTVTVTVKDLTPVVALPANRKGIGAKSAIGYTSLIGGLTGCNSALIDWEQWDVYMNLDSTTEYFRFNNIASSAGRWVSDTVGQIKANWRG